VNNASRSMPPGNRSIVHPVRTD